MIVALAVKATLAVLFASLVVLSLRRARASLRHLVLAALFAFLLLLPLASRVAPRWAIEVDAKAPRALVEQQTEFRSADTSIVRTTPVALTSFPISWSALYLTGTALLLTWLGIGVLRLQHLARSGEVWLDGTARLNEIARDGDIRRSALVVLSNDVTAPLTFGFRRSTVVLPFAARAWSADALTRALRHELEHIRREDWLLQLIARAAVALYWLHPLVWIAWRRFCLEAERACDDAVVDACEAPDLYAGQLVALARDVRRMSAIPALGMASRSRLSLRIAAILDPAQPRGRSSRAAATATLIVAFALLVSIAPAQLVAAAAQIVVPMDAANRETRPGAEELLHAAAKGNIETARSLLDLGVDVNTVLLGDGTPLIAAAAHGEVDMVDFLLDRGADVNGEARGDGNPLIAAAQRGHLDVAERLLDRGARIDEVVPGDENALISAADEGHAGMVRLLIDRGADVNLHVLADRGEIRTALRMARQGGYTEIEQMLLRAGARE